MRLSVCGSSILQGDVQLVEKSRLGRGGAATVYRVHLGGRDWAAKIFDQERAVNGSKIAHMIANVPPCAEATVGSKSYARLAWPVALLRNANGADVGYIMPIINPDISASLDHFYDKGLIRKFGMEAETALPYRLEIARNVAALVRELHACGHHFVDVKPQNVRVFRDSRTVCFLDCDGFSISSSGGRFPAELISTDYIAPEAVRHNTPPRNLGEAQDLYALAVIIFQLLNRGTHPFQGILSDGRIVAPTNDHKAAAGLYPHGMVADPRIAPRAESVHHLWDDGTRHLFDRAFLQAQPGARPSAAEWEANFENILSNKLLVRCDAFPSSYEHIRFREKVCPACYLSSITKSKPTSTKAGNAAVLSGAGNHAIGASSAPSQARASSQGGGFPIVGWIIAVIFALGSLSYLDQQNRRGQSTADVTQEVSAREDVDLSSGWSTSAPSTDDSQSVQGAEELSTVTSDSLLAEGVKLHADGQYVSAIDVFNRLLQADDANGEAYFSRGLSYRALSEFNQAIADFSIAMEKAPGLEKARYCRGRAKLALGDEAGYKDVDEAMQVDPRLRDQAYVAEVASGC